mmetsp:Transcript_2238/g.3841  ORF Transcript_2238/g.3841 Transcript_2238/m.3841 type:complete len:366 (-) Transcript_2238:13-1110(-)
MSAEPLHTPASSDEERSPKARMSTFTHAEGLGMVMAHNHQGVQHLRSGNHEEALAELIVAKEILVELEAENVLPASSSASAAPKPECSFDSARAVTASNMGIYHKRMCKYPDAVRCLYAAIRWHEAFGTSGRTLAASHVNLSECLLEAKLPEVALTHARKAADLAGHLIAQGSPGTAARLPSHLQDQAGVTANTVAAELGLDDYAMLAIAYHKVAEAEEMLGNWSGAALAYTRAHAVLTWSLGPDDPLTKSFEQSTRCPKKVTVPVPRDTGPLRSALKRERLPRIPASARGHSWQPARQETWRYALSKEDLPVWPPQPASREERLWYRMAKRHQDAVRAAELEALRKACNYATAAATPRMSDLPL